MVGRRGRCAERESKGQQAGDPRTGRTRKRRRTALNATSINKTLGTLSAILETAAEYGYVSRNVAGGRRRRLPSATPARSTLDRAEHIAALLDGASKLDADASSQHGQRRALVAILVFAGLRIGEALALRWRDLDLARGTITVRAAKTDAGVRTVNMLAVLRDELGAYAARSKGSPDALVFGTSTGRQQSPTNIRRRLLAKAVEHANTQLAKAGGEPIAVSLTPHSLRRTFASILFAIGETPPYVMAQMGHTTAALTLSIYARQMNRRDGEPARLAALVGGADRTATDSNGGETREVNPVTSGAVTGN